MVFFLAFRLNTVSCSTMSGRRFYCSITWCRLRQKLHLEMWTCFACAKIQWNQKDHLPNVDNSNYYLSESSLDEFINILTFRIPCNVILNRNWGKLYFTKYFHHHLGSGDWLHIITNFLFMYSSDFLDSCLVRHLLNSWWPTW